jgi:hypothetical protein
MHHFAAFYELLKVQPRAKVLPFEPLPNGAAGVRPVYCPPAAFTL